MENNKFSYSYSAERNKEVESIRKRYMPREESKLDTLRALDLRVQNAGMIEALCLGVLGVLVFGVGMCFFLNVFAGSPVVTAVIMAVGVLLMLPAYPIYKKISRATRARLAPKILKLSEEIINSQKA